ncbi:MAG: hypothetical protein QXG14_02860 [Candidatus Hadarchaeales archaeon]
MGEISALVLKAGFMTVWFVVVYLLVFYFWRKKVRNVFLASFFPIIPAFLAVIPFYDWRLRNWASEGKELLETVFRPKLVPFSLGVCLSLAFIGLGLLISRKARLGAWGWQAGIDPYRFRAVGQLMGVIALMYFVEFTGTELAFLLLMFMAVAFLAGEFFKSFYSPNFAEPSRPASRLRRISYQWTGTAGPAERFYFPSFFFLGGVLVVFLWLPKYIIPSLALLGFADPAATLVGTKFGRRKLLWGKTLEGSLSFFAISAAALVLLKYSLLLSLATAAIVTAVESVTTRGVDNLGIPLLTSLCLRFLPL